MKKMRYAGFGIRLLAFILDLIILYLPCYLVVYGIEWLTKMTEWEAVAMIAAVAIKVYCDSTYGATPGKRICNLRIVDANGSFVSMPVALFRYIVEMISFILFIGFLIMLGDEKKQTYHDRKAETYVIKV